MQLLLACADLNQSVSQKVCACYPEFKLCPLVLYNLHLQELIRTEDFNLHIDTVSKF